MIVKEGGFAGAYLCCWHHRVEWVPASGQYLSGDVTCLKKTRFLFVVIKARGSELSRREKLHHNSKGEGIDSGDGGECG